MIYSDEIKERVKTKAIELVETGLTSGSLGGGMPFGNLQISLTEDPEASLLPITFDNVPELEGKKIYILGPESED